MGISYSRVDHRWVGNQREVVLEASFDASYTAGGEALTAGDAGLREIDNVNIESGASESGYVARWDDANGTLMMFEETDSTSASLGEVAGSTDLSTETLRVTVRGRGS